MERPQPIDGPSDRETLLRLLLEKYWTGVYREVKHILLSLVELQDVALSAEEKEREQADDTIRYGTFIEQICEMPGEDRNQEGLYSHFVAMS